MNKSICASVVLSMFFFGAQAQDAIPASGGNASGSGGTAAYSVGQTMYTTSSSGSTGSVSPGVQQAYEITVINSIGKAEFVDLHCVAFPNPTTDYLVLKVDSKQSKTFVYRLFDENGNLLETKKVEAIESRIDMSRYAPAAYILKVLDKNNSEIKTFKILKK